MTSILTPDGIALTLSDSSSGGAVGVAGGRAIDGRAIDVTTSRELRQDATMPPLRHVSPTGMVTVTLADWRPSPPPAPGSGHALTLRLDPVDGAPRVGGGAISTVVAVDCDGKPAPAAKAK